MTELNSRILELDRSGAYEAAQLLAEELGAQPDVPPLDDQIIADPLRHLDDVEALSRVLLLTAVEVDPAAVERALSAVGSRNFILGGAEIVALAVLVTGALQVVIARGKIQEETTTTVEESADGSRKTVITSKVEFGISSGVARLLKVVGLGG